MTEYPLAYHNNGSTAVVGGGVPVTWAKAPSSTDPTVPDYKSAYKRVKRQRAYYKQAALSLLEELYMLRGEPRKADEHAAKGVSFDIKRAQVSNLYALRTRSMYSLVVHSSS